MRHACADERTYMSTSEQGGRWRKKESEGSSERVTWRLWTGTLYSKALAYSLCHPTASSCYYATGDGKWALVIFLCLSALTGMWLSAAECLLLVAVTWGVWVWLSFLFSIRKAWFEEKILYLHQSWKQNLLALITVFFWDLHPLFLQTNGVTFFFHSGSLLCRS